MKQEPKVMYSSDDAAQKVTVTGWRSRNGHSYGDHEHLARWDGCTHQVCDCGAEMSRGYTICQTCSATKRIERYKAMALKEWDGETMLTLHDDDKYFRDEDEVRDYSEENDCKVEDLRLVICEPQYAWEIDPYYYCDILQEDQTLEDCYPELAAAIDKVTGLIRLHAKPISWSGGKYRTSVSPQSTQPTGRDEA